MRTAAQIAIATILLAVGSAWAVDAEKAPKMLSHDVYFTLKDDSPKAKEALVAGCKKFLSEHPGVVWFAAGALVEEHDREVNDRSFDVALHIVFKDKASHDKYQEADSHHKFIEEFNENWESVRVFDSWLTATAHGEDDAHKHDHDAHGHDHDAHDHKHVARSIAAKTLKLPDDAAHFAGMIEGKVVAKTDRGLLLQVEKVLKTWRNSKAKDPKSLVGKRVHIIVKSDGNYGRLVRKFVSTLKPGEGVELDVAHREGEVLVILELTEKQRHRVAD
jgi:stress responsive alpha/beta barrel protein